MDAPRALAIIGDETACSLWRVWQPFAELERRGFVADWCNKDDSDKVLPLVAAGRYNVVITPRIVWPMPDVGDKWVNAVHRSGMAWLYESDDDCFSSAIVDRQYRTFQTERDKGRAQLEWERQERIRLLQSCDGIIVASRRLATVASSFVGGDVPVYVVPNAIDARWFRETLRGCSRIPELQGKLTIGWAGGMRDEVDLKIVADAWAILAERYPKVMFVVQGFIPDLLKDAVPQHRRMTLPWLPIPEYPRGLLNFDIGCCAVASTLFSSAKTPIKWFEMTLAGAACVVSPTLYGTVVTDGVDGLIAKTTEDWVAQLSRLIESADLRGQIQREARRTVMTHHSLENNWWRWPEAWADAAERFRAKRERQLVLARG